MHSTTTVISTEDFLIAIMDIERKVDDKIQGPEHPCGRCSEVNEKDYTLNKSGLLSLVGRGRIRLAVMRYEVV